MRLIQTERTLAIAASKTGMGERPPSALRDWLELRPECSHDFLFLSSDRRPLGRRALMGLLRKALLCR
jgi:hypothetical protein